MKVEHTVIRKLTMVVTFADFILCFENWTYIFMASAAVRREGPMDSFRSSRYYILLNKTITPNTSVSRQILGIKKPVLFGCQDRHQDLATEKVNPKP